MCSFTLEIILAVVGVLLVAVDAFATSWNRKVVPLTAIVFTAIILALLLISGACASLPAWLGSFYEVTPLAFFYKVFSLVTTLGVLVIAYESDKVVAHYSSSQSVHTRIGEFYALPLIICAGMMWMASAKDLVSVFVPLELVTVSFYVLVAYTRRSASALEAGVKYLILGALSTGIFVYGIAWVYGTTGAITFQGIAEAVVHGTVNSTGLLFGAALLLGGLCFKVGAAPFHIWIPDVYQGAPTPVTAFLSVGSKAAGFVVLTKTVSAFTVEGSVIGDQVRTALVVVAALTIAVGSLAAITQTNLKRLFAYSSISHAGFLVLALACGTSQRLGLSTGGIVAFYLATYLPMTLLGFLLIAVLRNQGVGEELKDLTGLARRSPGIAFALTVALASLAGLPLTAGFFGKMLVFVAAVDRGYTSAVIIAVVGAAAGFYYYFRPILAVYSTAEKEGARLIWSPLSKGAAVVLMAGIIILGVYPKAIQTILNPAPATVAGK